MRAGSPHSACTTQVSRADTGEVAMDARPQLVGNRLVLVGAVLYLLEWVAIIAAGIGAPVGAAASTQDLLTAYVGHAQALGWPAGW